MGQQLTYQIPDTGRKKTILRIPESHDLYLCPDACGRRQGIRALKNGEAEHASFLCFSQADVALGDYLHQIDDAVDAVLNRVQPTPRVLTLHVNCIDDFLGTDTDALLADLSRRHPDVTFLLAHLNPIADDVRADLSPAQVAQAHLYAPLVPVAPEEHDAGVNVVGAFVSLPASSEVHEVLRVCGTRPDQVRDLMGSATFADYQLMARSRLTLSLGRLGDAAAADMEARLGIPWLAWPACYDLDEIARRYGRLAAALGAGAAGELTGATGAGAAGLAGGMGEPGLAGEASGVRGAESAGAAGLAGLAGAAGSASAAGPVVLPPQVAGLLADARGAAEEALAQARAALGDIPVLVDTSASLMPFSLALTLLGWGFNVRAVFALHSKGWDEDARRGLEAAHPEVAVLTGQGAGALRGYDLPQECVSVGRDAAFLVRARHVADLYHDEGCFGFDGVARLARLLAASLATTKEWDA